MRSLEDDFGRRTPTSMLRVKSEGNPKIRKPFFKDLTPRAIAGQLCGLPYLHLLQVWSRRPH